jgi:hypothetical protein
MNFALTVFISSMRCQQCGGHNVKIFRDVLRVSTSKIKFYIIIIIINVVSCHRPFLPGTSLEPAVIPTAQASSFTLQYFPYYV